MNDSGETDLLVYPMADGTIVFSWSFFNSARIFIKRKGNVSKSSIKEGSQRSRDNNNRFSIDSSRETSSSTEYRNILMDIMLRDELAKIGKLPKTNASIDPLPGLICVNVLQINKDNVSDLIRLADKYNAAECMIKCIEFLKGMLGVESVCFVLDVAWESSWMVLAAVHGPCIDIVYEHFDAVIKTCGFSTCRSNTLQTILSQKPSSRHEFNVIEAVVKWAQRACVKNGIDAINPQKLRQAIGVNFNLIDFGAMTEIDFFTCQLEHRLLSAHEISKLVSKISDKI